MFVARIIRSAKKYVVGKVESFDWVFSKGLIDQLRDWRPGASSRYADTTRLSHRSSMWVTFPQMSIQMLQPNVRMFALPRHVMNRRPFNRTMLHCHNTHGLPFLRDGSKVRNRQRTRRTSISSAPTSSPYEMRWNCHTVSLIFMQSFFFFFSSPFAFPLLGRNVLRRCLLNEEGFWFDFRPRHLLYS